MSKRKFYKLVFTYEVLSESPIPDSMTLEDFFFATQEGDMCGNFIGEKYSTLTGKQAAKALIEQGSDPEFFLLDKAGNDIEQEEV